MILIKKEKYINIYKIFDFIVRQELSEFTLVESKVTRALKQEATKSLASLVVHRNDIENDELWDTKRIKYVEEKFY